MIFSFLTRTTHPQARLNQAQHGTARHSTAQPVTSPSPRLAAYNRPLPMHHVHKRSSTSSADSLTPAPPCRHTVCQLWPGGAHTCASGQAPADELLLASKMPKVGCCRQHACCTVYAHVQRTCQTHQHIRAEQHGTAHANSLGYQATQSTTDHPSTPALLPASAACAPQGRGRLCTSAEAGCVSIHNWVLLILLSQCTAHAALPAANLHAPKKRMTLVYQHMCK